MFLKVFQVLRLPRKVFIFMSLVWWIDGHRQGKKKWLDNFDGTTPSVREVNLIDVESNGSSSPEESPQDYKPAEYLLIYKK